jgi:hypothetical protein
MVAYPQREIHQPNDHQSLESLISIAQDFSDCKDFKSSKIIFIRVLPRIRSKKVEQAMKIAGVFEAQKHYQMLDFAVLNPDETVHFKFFSAIHDSWPEGYGSYVQQTQKEADELRAQGYQVRYIHFDPNSDKFVFS